MKIIVTGNVLRDKDDTSKRNYVNIVLTVESGKHKLYYHIRNYQVNSKSISHRMMFSKYERVDPLMKAFSECNTKKLARNRVVDVKILDEFSDFSKLEKALTNVVYRISMKDGRKIINRCESDLTAHKLAYDHSESFDERMERKLAEADDFSEIERKSGVGKYTAEKSGSDWGMF